MTSPEWNHRTKRTVAVIGFLAVIALFWLLREMLPIIIVSALLAFIMHPFVTFLSKRVLFFAGRASRGWAVLFTFIGLILLVTLSVLLVLPALIDQVEGLARSLPSFLSRLEEDLEVFLAQPLMFGSDPILINGREFIPLERIAEATGTKDLGEIFQLEALDLTRAAQTFAGTVPTLSGPAFSFLGGAFNTIINITFLLILTFYLAKDGAFFVDRAATMVPEGYEGDARRLMGDMGMVWNAYIRGQLILCVVMGVVVYLAASLLGVPNAPLLGLLAGLFEFVPNIGPFLALIPAAFLGLVSTSSTLPFLSGLPFMLVIIIVWTMLQNLEAIFLVPRIMGTSLDLHPFVVIVAVLGGAVIAGALGVILAAPFVASGRVIATYVYGKLTGRHPFIQAIEAHRRRSPTAIERFFRQLRRQQEPVNEGDQPDSAS